MKRSRFSSLDVKETLIDSDDEEVDSLMSHEEEVVSPLKEREEFSYSRKFYSKESITLLEGEDAKTGLGSSPSLLQLEGLHLKLRKSSSSIEE